jgi:hypothetical protein
VFFTDPTRGSQPGQNLFCAAPEDANKTVTIYARYTSPTGQTVSDTAILKIRRNDGK